MRETEQSQLPTKLKLKEERKNPIGKMEEAYLSLKETSAQKVETIGTGGETRTNVTWKPVVEPAEIND
jgi:hypothetical protein